MLAPVGSEKRQDAHMPTKQQTTDITDAQTAVPRKLLVRRIALVAGKMISAEISIAPITRIPTTTVTAVTADMANLYIPVLIPVAFANVSSNVSEKRIRRQTAGNQST